jgi:hypothetical protein
MDCLLAKAIRSGQHDDIMWHLFENIAHGGIKHPQKSKFCQPLIGDSGPSKFHIWLLIEWMAGGAK